VIRIRKGDPPAVLRERGARATERLRADYDAAPAEYGRGARRFRFDRGIYAHPAVKKALCAAQHGKCAFCEPCLTHTGYGDVEHLRPKAGYKQRPRDALRRPGYYWLAYEWDNLFFSCQLCNQRFKRNLFPLANPRQRARSHREDLARERPLLINPGQVDPAAYLGFREEMAHPVRRRREGKTTIQALGLNRKELVEVRLRHLTTVRDYIETRKELTEFLRSKGPVPKFQARLESIDIRLRALAEDRSEYAAMTRAAIHAARLDHLLPNRPGK
jgi:uncharacterized protein (TIGR02646 family)